MATAREVLTRRIGPLPTWAWLAAGAGGIIVSRVLLRRRDRGEAPAPSFGAVGDSFPVGLGESALPVDVTGRAPGGFDEALPSEPIGFEPIFTSPGFFVEGIDPTTGLPDTPSSVVTGTPTLPAGCDKPTRRPIYGGYADAPNRWCPQGWHLQLFGPCIGKCVPNVG